ncbi:hypothetical protein [Desulfovibrio inopinatus]|uniref:hypothetical protein n=1 Tax=Desulfovibrio inopinatus TaxID=102109 RepID=UPI0004156AC0|nr:hypothetical protein [Desulfovibrio inopinatus]
MPAIHALVHALTPKRIALALLLLSILLTIAFAPPIEHGSHPVQTRQCPTGSCQYALESIVCKEHHLARLDMYDVRGGELQVVWGPPGGDVTYRDPYLLPQHVDVGDYSSLYYCYDSTDPIEASVQHHDALPLQYRDVSLSLESPLTVFADSLRVSVPVFAVLLVCVLVMPRRYAWFSIVFTLTLLFYTQLAFAPGGTNTADNRFYVPSALALINTGTLAIDGYAGRNSAAHTLLTTSPSGHFINYYPVGVTLMITPLVAWTQHFQTPEVRLTDAMAKLFAALSVALFFVICRRLGLSTASSLLLCGVFALTTSQYSIHAGSLSSHNISSCLSLVAIALLMAPEITTQRIVLLSVVSILGLICRHDFAFIIGGCGLTLLLQSYKQALLYAACLGILIIPCLAGSHALYGHWLPPYVVQQGPRALGWNNLYALAGLLISPNRGLFVYSPFLILGFIFAIRSLCTWSRSQALAKGLAVTVLIFTVVLTTFPMWWGGWCYGPRLFCSMLGLLMVLSAMAYKAILQSSYKRVILPALVPLVLWGFFVHAKGALIGDTWNGIPQGVDQHPERVWDMHDTQILRNAQYIPIVLDERLALFTP